MSAAADWDLTPYFRSVDSDEFREFFDELRRDVRAMTEEVEAAPALDDGTVGAWAERLSRIEDIHARAGHVSSYLGCAGAADAKDTAVKRESARLSVVSAELTKLFVALQAVIRDVNEATWTQLLADPRCAGAEHYLRRMRERAQLSMEPALESLAADLAVDGIHAWGRLYDQVSGSLDFELDIEGEDNKRYPVSMVRTLLEDARPEVRRAAARGSGKAWEQVSDTVAACLNAIAGTRLTLYQRRGIDHFLEPALFDAGIERATLDCMLDTVRKRQDLPRRFLRAKAERLGMERLAFCDLMAPLTTGTDESRIPWADGTRRVQEAFSASVPELGELAERAFRDKWIDYTPRQGKRPGGFCSSSHVIGQSRIFMTYNGATGDVQTLAHELGHAYHNWIMRDLRSWGRRYPMPLAETASTFAENITTTAVLNSPDASDAAVLAILDARLTDAEAFMLNIPMRFDFECELYTRRADGELSVRELCDMMLDAQRNNYGDALDPDALDPWFWASKLHFYITSISFYNFPYTFGYLFSQGLFRRFVDEGASFLPAYRDLLRQTGAGPAEQVVKDTIGVDLTRPEFWNQSIDLIEADFERYQKLRA